MLKYFATASLTTLTVLTLGSLTIHAQESKPTLSEPSSFKMAQTTTTVGVPDFAILGRAQNLARQAAERANGGLNYYRAERSMFGPPSQAPVRENEDGSFTFTFQGHTPGSEIPAFQSVVTVSRDGNRVTVESNGPVR